MQLSQCSPEGKKHNAQHPVHTRHVLHVRGTAAHPLLTTCCRLRCPSTLGPTKLAICAQYGNELFVLYLTPRPLSIGLVATNYEGFLNQVRSSRLHEIPKYCAKKVKLFCSTNMRFSFDGQTKNPAPWAALRAAFTSSQNPSWILIPRS